jgi:carboxyl-terminal processing protease
MRATHPAIRRVTACSVLVLALAGCRNEQHELSEPDISSIAPIQAVLIDEAIDLMDKHGFYATGPGWQTARTRALELSKGASDAADSRRIIDVALGVAGGPHSKIADPIVASASRAVQSFPIVDDLGGGVVSLTLPSFSGANPSQIDEYVMSAWKSIEKLASEAKCGWILDVRENSGGNLWPMMGAISPLLDLGPVMSFSDRDDKRDSVLIAENGISLGETKVIAFDSALFDEASRSVLTRRVVVLTGPNTGSSGEAIPIAFTGQDNAMTMGQPTYGLSSANRSFTLADGSILILTVAVFADRTGILYGAPVEPLLVSNDYGSSLVSTAAKELTARC